MRTPTTVTAARPGALRLLVLVLALALGVTLGAPGALAEADDPATTPVPGAEQDLGYAIPGSVLSPDSSLGVGSDGRLYAFYVSNGNDEVPIMLQVVDVEKQELAFFQRAPRGKNSWATAYSPHDQRVYFGSTDGDMYSWGAGDTEITDLGTPFEGEGVWRLTAAPDGLIYGGTYPGALLFSYDPASGEFEDLGSPLPGETYLRGLDANEDYVVAGSQPNAELARIDRDTGEVRAVESPLGVQNTAYDITIAAGLLFVRYEPINALIVYDLETLEIVNTVEKITGRVISDLDPTGRFVMLRLNNGVDPVGIYRYYVEDHRLEHTGFNPNALPGAYIWHEFEDQETFPGHTLVLTYNRGRTYARNFESSKGLYIGESILEKTPNPIQEVAAGPDGKIYVPGFLSPPSMAQFDPADDTFTQLAGAGQVEGLGVYDDLLLMGRYPNGLLTSYDTTQPWDSGTNPAEPRQLGSEQDRPQSIVRVGDRVAVSSVPKSGRLGGAITFWDPISGEMEVHTGHVQGQAPVSLAEHDGLLYTGTTINGGYGIDPVATEAHLIIVDPATGEVVHDVVPVPGARTVSALRFDAQGKLWANADGALVRFDPETREVELAEQIFPVSRSMYGTDRHIQFREDGYLYATSGGALWRVDPDSLETIRMAHTRVAYLAQDPRGDLYYARGSRLYRWDFAAESAGGDLAAPVTTATRGFTSGKGPRRLAVTLSAEDASTVTGTEYRIDGGAWTAYQGPIVFAPAPQPYRLEFRSTDSALHREGIRTMLVGTARSDLRPGCPDQSAPDCRG